MLLPTRNAFGSGAPPRIIGGAVRVPRAAKQNSPTKSIDGKVPGAGRGKICGSGQKWPPTLKSMSMSSGFFSAPSLPPLRSPVARGRAPFGTDQYRAWSLTSRPLPASCRCGRVRQEQTSSRACQVHVLDCHATRRPADLCGRGERRAPRGQAKGWGQQRQNLAWRARPLHSDLLFVWCSSEPHLVARHG
jgi:hypothetical protein